jgi:SacI homology domain/Endonuclease/Exonuclease/phosphatase family
MLTSVIRGFARTLAVPPSSSPIRRKVSNKSASLTVISRLSSRRAGTRFNSRGIDDSGNVANFVETETIFWSPTGLCLSYTQVRGSVPIFWESSSSLIPGQQKVHITRSPEATQPAFDRHFENLEKTYGAIHVLNLLSAMRPAEVDLSERFRQHIQRSPLRRHDPGEVESHELLRATEFDFNEHTRGASGYEGAQAIRPYIDASAESFVYFLSEEIEEWTAEKGKPKKVKRPAVIMQQNGVFRVNCLDCLDRTNLVQGMLSRLAIEQFLGHRDEQSNSDFWMRHSTLWADNGDALSKIYAGTGALKSSFTRHGKMSLAGALADARKSATRLYVNHFEDKGRQNTVDLLLGRLSGQNSVDLFDPVNDWVVAELGKRRLDFESRAQIKVLVGTYNLNGKTKGVNEDLSPWLDAHRKGIDIVVVGFQEIVELSPQQIMSTDPNRRMAWERAVRNCLNGYPDEKADTVTGADDYVVLRSGQLVGAALLIFVRSSLLARITNVEGAIKKTGMSGIAGNKGAVGIRMEIDSTSVCFVTAHLAAGFGNYDERNRDYNTITSGLRFARDHSIDDHEVVVWAGDFNYRIGLSYEKARALSQEVKAGGLRAEEALGKLYENDQLNIQMVQGNCFQFYREGRVSFLPTYKYDLGKDEFDSSDKQRIPAWTDRILFKVNQQILQQGDDLGTKLKQVEYESVMQMRFSDHRPVYSVFEMGVRVIDEAKKDELIKKLYRRRAKEVKSRIRDDGTEEENEEGSDIEELMGYQSIQEGLPPASSDRRKWWLDGEKGASSRLEPPRPGMKLNANRAGNPWKDGTDDTDDWVQVERPSVGSDAQSIKSVSAMSQKEKVKPEPPPSRGTSGRSRPVPPPWEGDRTASPNTTSTATTAPGTENASTPPPPPPSRAALAERGRTPSTTSVMSTNSVSKKPPPPKPTKPSALTGTASPAASPALPERHPSVSAMSIAMVDNDYNDDRPPPLPKRMNTASTTASTTASMVSASSNQNSGEREKEPVLRKLPPPLVQPRRVSKLQGEAPGSGVGGRSREGSVSSTRSAGSGRSVGGAGGGGVDGMEERPPVLPPRRAPTDMGLMDREDEEGRMGGYEVLRPR